LIYLAGTILFFAPLPVVNVRLVLFADVFLRMGAVAGVIPAFRAARLDPVTALRTTN